MTWTDEVETGEEYTQKNAWGDFCISEKDGDRVKWTNVSISMCEIDPQVLVMLGGAVPNQDAEGNTIGVFFTQEPNPVSFAIEVWTKKAGTSACDAGGAAEWGYFAGVNVRNGMLDGDLVIENAPLALGLKGELYGAAEAWGTGPYEDNPLMNPAGWPEGALRYIGVTTVQPPEDTVGCVAINQATGATAGLPGTWTPADAFPPQSMVALTNAIPERLYRRPPQAGLPGSRASDDHARRRARRPLVRFGLGVGRRCRRRGSDARIHAGVPGVFDRVVQEVTTDHARHGKLEGVRTSSRTWNAPPPLDAA